MRDNNLSDYENNDGIGMKLLSLYSMAGWGLSLMALISIVGIAFLPVLIPSTLFAGWHLKKKARNSEGVARQLFQKAGFQPTLELDIYNAKFLVDEEKEAFAYWLKGVGSFVPGMALLDEVTEVSYSAEGDTLYDVGGGLTQRRKGKAPEVLIKFRRVSQPVFLFNTGNWQQAEKVIQQFAVLAKLS